MYKTAFATVVCCLLFFACANNRGGETKANGIENDTNRTDSRRNSTTTTNYLTNDTSKNADSARKRQ